MAEPQDSQRSTIIAAAVILVVAMAALYFLPSVVLFIGRFSPVLAVIVGVLVIAAFFGIFWLRAQQQRKR